MMIETVEPAPFHPAVWRWNQWMHDTNVWPWPAGLKLMDDGTIRLHSPCGTMLSEPVAILLATPQWAQLTWYGHEHAEGPTLVSTDDELFARLKAMWLSDSTKAAIAAFSQKIHDAGLGL